MPDPLTGHKTSRLSATERVIAAAAGVALLAVAVVIVVSPPERRVALARCPNADAGCIVSVDSDLTTFAAVLAGIGAVAVLLGLLGIRFDRVKFAGTEFGFERETAGLAQAQPADDDEGPAGGPPVPEPAPEDVPIRVEVRKGLGERLHAAPVAITTLIQPISEVDSSFLRDYQSARKVSQHSYFLTHILGPATQPGQHYSVAIRVTPHRDADLAVKSATFYLGRAWGNKTFEGKRGIDGRFGITTEAYGPFLALCELEFDNGSRILLDHYCDFDMGSLLPT
jgi:hypothetical protein